MPRRAERIQPGPRPTVSIPEAAALLGIPKRTLYDYAQKGMIPHIKVVRKVLLLRRTVDAWLKQGHITIKYNGRLDLPAEQLEQQPQPW